MTVVTLRANAHLAIPNFPMMLSPQTAVSYHVESEFPTHVFAVKSADLEAFRAGKDFGYWGAFNAANTPLTNHHYVGPTVSDPWHLVIVNYSMMPTAVYYRIPAGP